jgi:hypothetical protein
MCAEGILRDADLVDRRLPRAAKVRHQSTGSVQASYWGLANALENNRFDSTHLDSLSV